MIEVAPWIWIGLLLLGVAAIGGFVVELVRRKWAGTDENWSEVLELIDWVLDVIANKAKEEMREIPLDEVGAVARAIYRQFVAGTMLEKVIKEDAFVSSVVGRWSQLIGVERAVLKAMQIHQVTVGTSSLA